MGPLPSSAFPKSLRATAKAKTAPGFRNRPSKSSGLAALALITAGILGGCITDGPNQTGGAYLAKHDVVLANPLYHVQIKGFPVDSFWTTELEPGHIGDSILLAGRSGPWYAEPRFSWNISDTSMLDSMKISDSVSRANDTTLRLSLSSPVMGIGDAELKALVSGATGKVEDTARFVARSWVINDSGISNDAWSDTNVTWRRRYLGKGDSVINSGGVPTISQPTVTDTITLRIKSAYDSTKELQACGLPELRKYLLKTESNRHIVHIRLARIPNAGADSGSSMLRLGGDWGTGTFQYRGPTLLFGRMKSAASGVANKNRLLTLDMGNSVRAVSYSLRYDGSRNHILNAKIRGLHVTFDRARFLDSLDAALRRQGITPAPRTSNPLSLAYFVPFAKITLPIDTPTLEGGFPLPVNLLTMTDTLLGDTLEGSIQELELKAGEAKPEIWTVSEVGRPEVIRNHVGLAYKAIDTSLNRVILTWSKDSVANDTLYIRNGETRQWNWTGTSTKRTMNLILEAKNPSLRVRSWLVVRRGFEYNELRDPATGEPIDLLIKKIPRFVKPGDQAITLRATAGIQNLLNRTRLGTTSLQDFQFEPSYSPIDDSAKNVFGTVVGAPVPYPLLDVIPPKIDSAKGLTVDLDYYLYPLKAR